MKWVVLSVILAIATYHLIENPVRHSGFLASRRPLTLVLGAGLILIGFMVSTVAVNLDFLNSSAQLEQAATGAPCKSPSLYQAEALRALYVQSSTNTTLATGGKPIQVDVFGDPTACTLIPGLQAVAPSYGARIGNGAVIGCGIVSGRIAPYYSNGVDVERLTGLCQSNATQAESKIIAESPPDIIVWNSTWEEHSTVAAGSGARVLVAGTPEWKKTMLNRIDQRLTDLVATGAKVIIVLPPPTATLGNPAAANSDAAAVARLDDLLREAATRHPTNVGVVDLASRVCPSGNPCPFVVAGVNLRPDGEHYGEAGSLYAASWLLPEILQTARNLPSNRSGSATTS